MILAILLAYFLSCKQKSTPDPEPVTWFPVLEASGTHYQIGHAIGMRFKPQIAAAFSAMQGIINLADTLIAQDPDRFYQCYVDTVQSVYPQFIEELQGMADATGLPFRTFFIECMIPEYIHLLGFTDHSFDLGCSTVSFFHDGAILLAHNEDGNLQLKERMYIVKAHPTGKPAFVSFCYPGLVMGVAPAMNDRGIFYSGNYVTGTEFREGGIPSSFIERSLMEATTMDEAISRATIPSGAYCFHVNIASADEGRLVGIEVTPFTFYLKEVQGFYIHTNHFVQPGITGNTVENVNTISRYEVLENLSGGYSSRLEEVTGDLLTEFLSSHDQWINSPCSPASDRHARRATQLRSNIGINDTPPV